MLCYQNNWLGLAVMGTALFFFPGYPSVAQIAPDGTLGTEASLVRADRLIRGLPATLIEGGAIRGSNLFQSFLEFNVDDGQRVYFANPASIKNIFGRVTGNTRSNVLGTLGVDGSANLFLLNPNGILFGPNARLDVAGSFTASTASRLVFDNGLTFSATNPETPPPLLTIKVRPGLQYDPNPQGTISNAGTLRAGQELTLAAGNLDLQGQLEAGGDLTLRSLDTLRVRDSITQPFIARAGGQLLVQGDRTIDIFALNHLNSGFFSGDNLVLRSNSAVLGDAHYSSGKGFRIETLDGSPGNLYSPYDPIIVSNGDVTFGSYGVMGDGASLHILAGGSVNIGTVVITGTGTSNNTINPRNTPDYAYVTLSDGSPIVIDGSATPTLDIRAGIDWSQFVGGAPGNYGIDVTGLTPANFSEPPSSANITIQNIENNFFGSVVLLSNQFFPNRSLPGGVITIGPDRTSAYGLVAIDARSNIQVLGDIISNVANANAGNVKLISGADIMVSGRTITTSVEGSGRAGDISITAARSLLLSNASELSSDASGIGRSGNITIQAQNLVAADGSEILTRTFGSGMAGDILLTVPGTVLLTGVAPFTGLRPDGLPNGGFSSGIFVSTENPVVPLGSPSAPPATGLGGQLVVNAGTLTIENGAVLSARSRSEGNGRSRTLGNGTSITVNANTLNISGGGEIITATYNIGTAGDVEINAANIFIDGQDLSYASRFKQIRDAFEARGLDRVAANERTQITVDPIFASSGIVTADLFGRGKAGNVDVRTQSLTLTGGATIQTQTFGSQAGGNITVNPLNPSAPSSVTISGIAPFTGLDALGNPNGGFSSGLIANSEDTATETGTGGTINVNIGTLRLENGGVLSSRSRGAGAGGDIFVNANSLDLLGGGQILTVAYGTGNAGDILATVTGKTTISGYDPGFNARFEQIRQAYLTNPGFVPPLTEDQAFQNTRFLVDPFTFNSGLQADVDPGATANAGRIFLSTGSLVISDFGRIATDTYGQGNAGLVFVQAQGNISLASGSSISSAVAATDAVGDAGGVLIQGGSLDIRSGAQIKTETSGIGNSGIVYLQVAGDISLAEGNTGIFSTVGKNAVGNALGVLIQARSLTLDSGAELQALTSGKGDAGAIIINTTDSVNLAGSSPDGFSTGVFASTERGAEGTGGAILVTTNALRLSDGAVLSARTRNRFRGGSVLVDANSVEATNGGQILTTAFSSGQAGDIKIGRNIDINTLTINAPSSTVNLSGRDGGFSDRQRQAAATEQAFGQQPGDIFDNVSPSSGLFSNTAIGSTARGGNIEVVTGRLNLQAGGQIAVNTQSTNPAAAAGDITLTTDSATLSGQGLITATTRSGRGGNIEISASRFLLLSGSSQIATDAGTDMNPGQDNAGNITITTPFIFAFPSRNNDITAEAYNGTGGRIRISAQRLFNIRPRPLSPTTNDISARSQVAPGVDGVVEITQLNIDPVQGISGLPVGVVDPSNLIAQGCNATDGSEVGQFALTGRGGLPPSPNDSLGGEAVWEDARLPTSVVGETEGARARRGSQDPALKAQNSAAPIVPAVGWVFNGNGEVTLVAAAQAADPLRSLPSNCRVR